MAIPVSVVFQHPLLAQGCDCAGPRPPDVLGAGLRSADTTWAGESEHAPKNVLDMQYQGADKTDATRRFWRFCQCIPSWESKVLSGSALIRETSRGYFRVPVPGSGRPGASVRRAEPCRRSHHDARDRIKYQLLKRSSADGDCQLLPHGRSASCAILGPSVGLEG
jgi:hypothetical protein